MIFVTIGAKRKRERGELVHIDVFGGLIARNKTYREPWMFS
jgi:hypothetical protein